MCVCVCIKCTEHVFENIYLYVLFHYLGMLFIIIYKNSTSLTSVALINFYFDSTRLTKGKTVINKEKPSRD